MSVRAFQGGAFQFGPAEAFQSAQALTADASLGTRPGYAVSAGGTRRGATTYAITGSYVSAAGLAFYNVSVLSAAFGTGNGAISTRKAAASLNMRGTATGTMSVVRRAAATLGAKAGASGPSIALIAIAVDLVSLITRIASSARQTRSATTSFGTREVVVPSARGTRKAAATLGESAALLNRQVFITPSLFTNTNRLNFQHSIAHRGGGNAAKKPARAVEPKQPEPTIKATLEAWKAKPFALPAPNLVRRTARDTRPAPKIKPLVRQDVLAIDEQLNNAFDHRDAMAMLEKIRIDAERQSHAQDEDDALAILGSLVG